MEVKYRVQGSWDAVHFIKRGISILWHFTQRLIQFILSPKWLGTSSTRVISGLWLLTLVLRVIATVVPEIDPD